MSLTACKGVQEHGCHYAHTYDHTHWHTHQGEGKKQVQLELNMYFNNLMRMVTNIHLEINKNTMHQYVAGPTTLKMMMCMLSDELDRGAISVYLDATEAGAHFQYDVTIECVETIMTDQA